MSANAELAMRNTARIQNECANENLNSHKIIDVDCVYESGKFRLLCLPCPLPALFTVRFTAPEDYMAGDVIAIKDKELPVRTPGMVNASSGLYKAGAVMQCDIDMDREIAFFWQGVGAIEGVLPNLSFNEQFAGFYDFDGSKVYVKTVDLGVMPTNANSGGLTVHSHGVDHFNRLVRMDFIWGSGNVGNFTNGSNLCRATCNPNGIYTTVVNWSGYRGIVTIYYTCTDR